MEGKYLLANPNFSEARNLETVEKIIDAVKDIDGVKLVKYEPEGEFNRTVVTLVGTPDPLMEALVSLTAKCVELIDMREHSGTHPRMGAMDVIPVYPFKNVTIDEAVEFSRELADRIFEKTEVPIFFTGSSATSEKRKKLPFIRKGQFEGLRDLLKDSRDLPERSEEYESRKPDLSVDGLLDEKAGGTVIGAFEDIAAFFNIFLDTEDLSIAKRIADSIRADRGGFSTVQAIGIKFDGRPGTVVSINVMDCNKTPIYRPFETVKREAERYGARVTGSELVGIVRLDFIINCFEHQLQLEGFKREHIVETHLM
jgi:glutamate formiminotransferase/formiminotetrahydrofolate cyclodeaminase